jgi:hypothetical protein
VRGVHVVAKNSPGYWNALLDYPGAYIASQWPAPLLVVPARYAQNISPTWYRDGEAMADAIVGGLESGGRAIVLLDEVRGDSVEIVADCAARMPSRYDGRWGAYLVTGPKISYPKLQPAIDRLLERDALILPEFYAHRARYVDVSHRKGVGAADRDLRDFFMGGGAYPEGRWRWLMARRKHVGSNSRVVPVFGVTDAYVDGQGAAKFLDRMFYVWVKPKSRGGTGWRGWLLAHGAGSWKWHASAVSTTSRDVAFVASSRWYVDEKRTASRLGRVG